MTPDELRTPGVRLYGPSLGNGSNARVTDGVRKALRELGVLDGYVPTDAFEDEQSYPGVWARTGVFFGPYHGVGLMRRGAHEKRYCLVAPNSTWLPRDLYETVAKHAELVAPSHWAAGIVENRGRMHDFHVSVSVWRHGVDDGFAPDRDASDTAFRSFSSGEFRILHLSSSRLERKGSAELIEAWGTFCDDGRCESPVLDVVCPPENVDLRNLAERCCPAGSVRFLDRLDLSVAAAAETYQRYHVVCQPSRGEAFGMVPLEARACGVPVVMTTCTGHREHVGPVSGGADRIAVVEVPTGGAAPIDDGPGAHAPELDPMVLYESLVETQKSWPTLKQAAVGAADGVRERWSWRSVTQQWLAEQGITKRG